MVPELRKLTSEETSALEAGLAFAARIAKCSAPIPVEQLQRLYDGFLEERIDENDALIALGLAFGAEIINRAPFEWVRVVDDIKEETCVAPIGRFVFCSPIGMIKKRLARQESVDLSELCDATIDTITAQAADPSIADR